MYGVKSGLFLGSAVVLGSSQGDIQFLQSAKGSTGQRSTNSGTSMKLARRRFIDGHSLSECCAWQDIYRIWKNVHLRIMLRNNLPVNCKRNGVAHHLNTRTLSVQVKWSSNRFEPRCVVSICSASQTEAVKI
ncbi:hypothetical protein BDN72DRAFT_832970 [Pluteus cervinus]|uniref:Uncharacterized protein n=1 Tax=Pluteus cervinus TaxID=181527 RepID=A0ACD3BAI7_9AGAR|nr:hypothetical protein BDN72DRAFT_832970 [Pluteus cervinus]